MNAKGGTNDRRWYLSLTLDIGNGNGNGLGLEEPTGILIAFR